MTTERDLIQAVTTIPINCRALCIELLDKYDLEWRARERLREVLAQPEPEPLTQASIALQMLDAIEHDSLYPPEVTAPIRRALKALHHDH